MFKSIVENFIFNFRDYGAVMKKSLSLALMLTVSLPALVWANSAIVQQDSSSTGIYQLDEEKAAALQQKAQAEVKNVVPLNKEETTENTADKPKIIKEETEDGYIEKLLSPDGKVIAEKTIRDSEVIKKVLNYYHPNGQISRQITAMEGSQGFYAEDFYPNGKLAGQATYLNENNKIGTEKRYDNNGVLRQEIPWVLPKVEDKDKNKIQQTIRQGNVITYYPDGRIAASFTVGKEGKNIFFNRQGRSIKEVENVNILNFAPDLNEENCKDKVVKLSLDELVELYEDEGDISYNKCGLPYRENFVYEIADIRGNMTSKISYDETGMIRKITPYVGGLKNGVEQKFDASGNLTAEINYKQGIKDGMANGYFPSKEVAFRKRYSNGKVSGTLTCYFPTGGVAAEFPYKNGIKEGVAKIYGPQAREIKFTDGKIDGAEPQTQQRMINPSKLGELSQPDKGCLDFENKRNELQLEVDANINTIKKAFEIDIPWDCIDFNSFKPENSNYACYDRLNRLRAVFPTGYNRGEYASETVYDEKGNRIYSIPYYQKQRQGIAQKFNENGDLLAEIPFNQDKQAESSRSYHPNGAVNEMITIADDGSKSVYVRYDKDGKLAFSANYSQNEKKDAFIAEPSKNKDIFIRFYDDKLDYVREVNATNPFNYIEYNLALGEYLVYKENKLIKGGHICGYEQVATPQETLPQSSVAKPEAEKILPPAEVKIADQSKATEAKEDKTFETIEQLNKAKSILTENVAETAKVMDNNKAQTVENVVKETKVIAEAEEPISDNDEKNAPVLKAESNQTTTMQEVQVSPKADIKEEKEKVSEEKAPTNTLEISASKPVASALPIITPKAVVKESAPKADIKATEKTKAPTKLNKKEVEVSPILPEEAAPMVEDLEPISFEDIKVKNAIIPTAEDKKEAELAAKNIGPVSKPDIEDLADVVSKEHLGQKAEQTEKAQEETQKLYYPNGNLRKTIKTKDGRTEEIKEYSKTGLLITDTMYEKDGILIEKYYGSGEIRRKTHKAYTDNAVMAFVSREDFYDNGNARYEIKRKPETLLFSDKEYYPEGKVKTETEQTGPLVFVTKQYAKDGKLSKETEQHGIAVIEKEYNDKGDIKSLKLNKADMPTNLAKNSTSLLKDSLKVYGKKGGVTSEFKSDGKSNTVVEYYGNGKVKTEIIFYNNGEISVKSYDKDGSLVKFAYLAPSGKLHIQKPSVQTIPSYRERYWVDYNNPRWIENQDKYSIKSIARLNLDTAAYVLAELKVDVPEVLKKLYDIYK